MTTNQNHAPECSVCHQTASHLVLVPWTNLITESTGEDWESFCDAHSPTAEDWELVTFSNLET